MKKYCFLVQCLSNCRENSGSIAILTTDSLMIRSVSQPDSSSFKPGTQVYWIPLSLGSCPAIILADLKLAGYDEAVMRMHKSVITNFPGEWGVPSQIVEVKSIDIIG